MIKAQRNMDANFGFGGTPDQLFAAAGLTKTGTYDGTGTPVADESAPAPSPSEPETETQLEQAPVSQPAPTIPTPTFDLNGKFDNRFKSLDEVETYLRDIEAKANQDPFANELVRNLNKAIQEGVDPELYMAVSQIDVNELSQKEALVLKMQWEKGLSFEDAEFIVNRTYKLEDTEEEPDMSDPDVREAQIRLGLDAQEAKEFLGKYKQEALQSPYEKMQQELTQAWTPVIPKVLENWKTFQVNSKVGSFNIPVSEGAMKAANELLTEVIKGGLLENMPDQDGLAIANAIVEKEIMKHDFQNAIDYIADALKAKQLEEKHNIRKPEGQTGVGVPTAEQGMIDWLKKVRY